MIYVGLTNLLFLLRSALVRNYVLRNQIYVFVIIILFVFSAFRYKVGCDWHGYYGLINQVLMRRDFQLQMNHSLLMF